MQVARSEIASLRWLGTTLRIAALSITPGAPAKGSARATASRAVVTIIDVATHSRSVLFDEPWRSEARVRIHACPTGRHLLVVPSDGAGATIVWSVPIGAAPAKVRMVPVQFMALAFVLPEEQAFGQSRMFDAPHEAAAAAPPPSPPPTPAAAAQDGAARHSSDGTSRTPPATIRPEFDPARRMSSDGHGAAGEGGSAFVFIIRDGRLGSISLGAKGVASRQVTQPRWSVQWQHARPAPAMAATEALVFIGDAQGSVHMWNTDTGETNIVPTAQKALRRIVCVPAGGPAAASASGATPRAGRRSNAAAGRLLLQYEDGSLAVRASLATCTHDRRCRCVAC